ncbi:CD2-associated protein [Boleophthalmus pectinirostris]|uniref:CD2-associated protein n=1 Tax=Boleophthalmus pectinirostris TaxID=150288 RepID=UPI00242C96BA|nr:CD2-associated protein [Boleophthalmus pectinirostris]
MEVVVEYDYEALHEDELTLRPGDIIKNVRCIEEDGWMEGELNGRRGLFPDNFVKEVKKDSKETKETKNEPKEEAPAQPPQLREKSAGNVANLVHRMSAIGIPLGGFQPHPPAASKKPKRRQCRVLFDYQPQNEDELELKVGDIIDVTEEVEEGWWSGAFNGKSGLFPSNFVKELDAAAEDGEPSEATPEEPGMKDGSVEAPASENVTSPTSPPGSSGNGALRPPSKIMGVGFGDIFAGTHLKLKPVPSVPSAKPAHPNHPTPTSTEAPKGDTTEGRGSVKRHTKEYCKVTFAFEATNEDELTLKEGDIIHILSKDTGEPGWWRGEVGGKEGVFPDNFVTVVNDADKDIGALRGSLKSSLRSDHEAKPRKPPPPSKQSIVLKPEVPSAEKKPHPIRSEDKVDKPVPEKHSKPAPLPPPKPGAGKGRPMSHPPKRPEKPLAPSASLRHNGEVPSTRSKPEPEPLPQLPVSRPRAPSVEVTDKPAEPDLMSFDDLTSTSHKLSHPTADRPKMPGKRPPTQFGSPSPHKEVNAEKFTKTDEEDSAKPKLTETKKPSISTVSQSSSHLRTSLSTEAKSTAPAPSGGGVDSTSAGVKGRLEPEDQSAGYEELRSQMRELLLTVELLKTQQTKEILELRGELEEERHKRLALQMEIEKLKRTVQLT